MAACSYFAPSRWLSRQHSLRPDVRSRTTGRRFRAATDSVSLGVSVRRQNRPVTGLRVSDFEIDDNGVPQQVVDLSYEKLPIDLTVALDISGSVSGALLDELRRAGAAASERTATRGWASR
jgi:hypothetical protein